MCVCVCVCVCMFDSKSWGIVVVCLYICFLSFYFVDLIKC